ncbi:MAG: ActS/PrrB/RegB family redox-sensitive histidine kinase [Candidatus Puniceispirillaceae bacterium]
MIAEPKSAERRWTDTALMRTFLQPRERRGSPPGTTDARVILNIRWLALAGQLFALLFTFLILEINIPIGPALFVIGLSVAMNVWQTRLTMILNKGRNQSFLALIFDVVQLSALLYFTGGLLNPFAVLLLSPVVVSATLLRRRETLQLIGLVAGCVSFLVFFNYPLPVDELRAANPDLYLTGLWMALVLSAAFIGIYTWWIASRARRLDEALSEARLALAAEQQAAALGTLATAAAHRLGSPLNTITVIGHELSRDISDDDPLYEDVMLLRAEIERCRVILGELDDYQSAESLDLETPMPLSGLIEEILDSRLEDGAAVFSIDFDERSAVPMPLVRRGPELMHALEDLLRNARDFARSQVRIVIRCTVQDVIVTINDDGPGFQAGVLAKVGAPWNTSRRGQRAHRGLGIFIASTLIESLGGSILYGNAEAGGGEVKVHLPLGSVATDPLHM